MEKNTYETYEYLQTNTNDTDQFFVVQDDGTFLINRQVQYVTQVQNIKEVLDGVHSCTVYGVTPQQLFVDNSAELISVSDQFVLPEGGNNPYTNNYLIQPATNTSTEQIEETITVDQYKQQDPILNLDVTQDVKQTNNCTEITLSDDQYQMLEQKGWILLETNDKIYLLDTLGLHDITTNDKLIHKLKTENQNSFTESTDDSRATLLESNILNLENNGIPNKQATNFNNGSGVLVLNQNPIEKIPLGSNSNDETIFNQEKFEIPEVNRKISEGILEDVEFKKEEPLEQDNDDVRTQVLVIENDDIRREGNTLKVKTRLSLKNIPDKIVLGQTLNGKQLVARVVKPKNHNHSPMEIDKREPDNPRLELTNGRKWEIHTNAPAVHLNNLLNETEFLSLIQHLIQNKVTKCCEDDIVFADSVISQLLQIPAFKATVLESYLVVTKTVQNEDSSEKTINKGLSAVITGKVSEVNDKLNFVYLPYMLQNMIHLCVFPKNKNVQTSNLSKQNFNVLHVQISETKHSGTNNVRVSATVNKRTIPMDLIAKVHKPLPTTMYACSACAALFKTEVLLKEHQENRCLKPDDILAMDIDELSKTTGYCLVDEGVERSYTCIQCHAKFSKLNACENHLKTHVPKAHENGGNEKNTSEVYKCNMCPCTYFHPSTLSKHILSRHINVRLKSNLCNS
ncbi:unnamed protein product [Diatraea saccharalis]|uniref:C2H2-type domain-containing protein n=1 Tax=Diatraea saccharalis TaxID=40085 RepID=A0A9N9WDM4_9NEOP|nr:unnamed protein product [Diatraea saccharalis]